MALKKADGLPSEWGPYFRSTPNNFDWFSLETVHYEVGDRGIPVPLPPLAADQQCQVYFNLAWFPEKESGKITCYDLGLNAAQILAGAGCS